MLKSPIRREIRPKNPAPGAQLILVGLFLILLLFFGAATVFGFQDSNSDPWGVDPVQFTWQVLSYTRSVPQCTLVIDHPGAPGDSEIRLSCSDQVVTEWLDSQACVSQAAYGQEHECEGLYLQWVASQPYSEFASIILNQPMWDILPAITNLPPWLSTPAKVADLATQRPMALLAGQLIAKQFVDANACPGKGLLPNGAANGCGEILARPVLNEWQNQFDSTIYGAALQTNVPPGLLKNILIQETQFWPASSRVTAIPEFGFGHLTENGADLLLMWNQTFFDKFCPTVLNPTNCIAGYFMLPSAEQAMLRGAVLDSVDGDCPTCLTGVDLEKASAAIPIVAHTLAASGKQVEQIILNLTGQPAAALVSYEDLWKFTAANYNAGPWCLSKAFKDTLRVGEYLRWKRIATHLPEECQGVIGYVKNITQFELPDEPLSELVSIPDLPTPLTTPAAAVTPVTFNSPETPPTPAATPISSVLYPPISADSSHSDQLTEIIVQFRPILTLFSGFVIRAAGGEKLDTLDGLRGMIIGVPVDQFSESLETLQDSWLVSYAEPNALVETHGRQLADPPASPLFDSVDPAQLEHQPEVIVAVIDSGIDIDHVALKPYIWLNLGEEGTTNRDVDRRSNAVDDDRNGYIDDWVGWNFVAGDNLVTDYNGHGTHTAGIIVAQSAGRAAILPVKALDASGLGTYAAAAQAIIYAVDQGAAIIHLGFGGLGASRTLQEAIDYAYAHDVLLISAAGNSGDAAPWYPAALPRVIAVAAVDEHNLRAPFSSFGEHISLSAPGVDILSTYPGGGTTILSGTSMATAYVSGAAAQLAALPQFDTPDLIRAALQNTALDLGQAGFDTHTGYGLVQPGAALAYLATETPTPMPWEEIAPTPLSEGGVQAIPVETLWGVDTPTAPTCTAATITTSADSTDQLFNNTAGSCAGFKKNEIWTYSSIQDTSYTTITSVTLNVRVMVDSGWVNDRLLVDVYDGTAWTNVSTETPAAISTYETFIVDVSAILDTPAKINAAQVQLTGKTNGQGETYTLHVDEVNLEVDGSAGSNTPPVANGESYSVYHDTTLNVPAAGVLTNDSDANLDPLTAVLDVDSTTGSLTLNSDGSFSYIPLADTVETVTFTYFANDGTENSAAAATVTINVTNTAPVAVADPGYSMDQDTSLTAAASELGNDTDGITNSDTPTAVTITVLAAGNNAPVAYGDSYSTAVDTPLNVALPGVLSNDTDGDSDPLTAVLQNDVTHGVLSLSADGSFTYTPTALFVGTDSFTYFANDGTVNSDAPATVTITVGSVNPHGGYTAATDMCAGCHRAHTAQGPGLLASIEVNNSFCFTCHDGSGVENAASIVSTHSNIDKAGVEASFELLCIQCHDPHGSSNLSAVRADVRVLTSPLTTTGPVVFTALTGNNSFDDGSSTEASRICVTCHVNGANPGNPMTNHTGGANHAGSVDYTTQDCTTCHKHDADDSFVTKDGFIPDSSCVSCHKQTQGSIPRRQIVDSAGDGTGTGGDFKRASHHLSSLAIPTDADCEVCHDQSAHQAGTVNLKDADGGPSYALEGTGDDADYTNFCLSCHDTGGSGSTIPFSDGASVIAVSSTSWSAASHYTDPLVGSCVDCHDNGHGSNKQFILAPWNYINDGNADDPMQQEERMCYTCHDGTKATTNIQTEMGRTTHHDVALTDQGADRVECVNCHNPHTNNATVKVSDPENWTNQWGDTAGEGFTNFCLKCHDGVPPAAPSARYSVAFEATSSGTGYNKTNFLDSTHDNNLTLDNAGQSDSCAHCHESHGGTQKALLNDTYLTAEGANVVGDFNICWRCHDSQLMSSNSYANAFGTCNNFGTNGNCHDHINGENIPCMICHGDIHAPYDAGEQGLINFAFPINAASPPKYNIFDIVWGVWNGTNSFVISGAGTDAGCGMNCHNTIHDGTNTNNTYAGGDFYYNRAQQTTTTLCSACHTPRPIDPPIR